MSTDDDLAPRYRRALDAMDAEHEAARQAEQAGQDWIADLAYLAARADDAEQAAEGARSERDDAIRDALAAKVRIPVIMAATGMSRARVYQVRDGRR